MKHCVYERIYVIGTGKFAFQCAKLFWEKEKLDCVYEYGAYSQSGLENLCKKNVIPYKRLDSRIAANETMKNISRNRERTLIISASNTYIFPDWLCINEYIDIINYHPALLEYHLGRNTEAWSIWAEDAETGVTWHKVTPEIDKGNIYIEKRINLNQRITSLELMIKQYRMGIEGLKEILEKLLMQDEIEQKIISVYGKMHYSFEKPNNGILDVGWSEKRISAFLRAMDYGTLNVLGIPT